MKQTIVVCDCCPGPVKKPAVHPPLDLCAQHKRQAKRLLRGERKSKRKVRVNERVEIAPRRVHINPGKAPWQAREATLLALLPPVGSIGTQELERRVMSRHAMSRNVYGLTLMRLKKAGLIAQKGERGIGVSYARAEAASG